MARKAEYVTITPARAKELLAASKRKNRPISNRKVSMYADLIRRGLWDADNSQGISIDSDGNLVNGHHRLLACIEANVSFDVLLITGVKPNAFLLEDTGIPRNTASYLSILGNTNSSILGSAARALRLWEKGKWASIPSGGSKKSKSIEYVMPDDIIEEIEARPSLLKAVKFVADRPGVFTGKMPKSYVATLYALTLGHTRHNDFWQEFADGINMQSDSPVRLLRNRLDSIRTGHRLTGLALLALLTKCWNAYATNTKLIRLAFGDIKSENFPQPITKLRPRLIEMDKKAGA